VSPPANPFTPQQRLLAEHFLNTRGLILSRERIIALLYGGDWHGGPDDAAGAVRKHIARLRQRLEPHGIRLLTMGLGQGAEGWLVDPEHLGRLADLLAAAPAMAVEVARARLAVSDAVSDAVPDSVSEGRIGDD
jgi:hypothetical protein